MQLGERLVVDQLLAEEEVLLGEVPGEDVGQVLEVDGVETAGERLRKAI